MGLAVEKRPSYRAAMPMPVALTIAGSDCSAGAGAQADLKTMNALGVYGLTALTCVVAEVPGRVGAIAPLPPGVVAEQIRLCLETFPVAALKTGMLHSKAVVDAVCGVLEAARPGALVVDPVMVATSGAPLLEPGAARAVRERLFPLARLVTPNLAETAALWGRPVGTPGEMREAGRALCARHGCAFLIKGGHLLEGNAGEAADWLLMPGGGEECFTAARVPGVSTHGTGCALSAAITAGLAAGLPLREAVARGKAFVTRAIAGSHRWGRVEALNTAGAACA